MLCHGGAATASNVRYCTTTFVTGCTVSAYHVTLSAISEKASIELYPKISLEFNDDVNNLTRTARTLFSTHETSPNSHTNPIPNSSKWPPSASSSSLDLAVLPRVLSAPPMTLLPPPRTPLSSAASLSLVYVWSCSILRREEIQCMCTDKVE
jgi:hypothetical protein